MEEKLRRAETQRNFLTKQNEGLKAIIQLMMTRITSNFQIEMKKMQGLSTKETKARKRRTSKVTQLQQMMPIRTIMLVLDLARN